MESVTRETGHSKNKKLRNKKLLERYNELWQQGLRPGIILDTLEAEFFISRPRIYSIINVKVLQSQDNNQVEIL